MTHKQKSRLITPMELELALRIDKILQNLSANAVINGLEPVRQRISVMFGETTAPRLYDFCQGYIRLAPDQTATLHEAAANLNLTALVDSYTELANRYLTSACNELENSPPEDNLEALLILMQGAYIFARMQEELDDKVQAFIGVPLSAMDLMDANLVIHEVIGDQFANRLDKVISSLIQQSKISKALIEANLDQELVKRAKLNQTGLIGTEVKSFAAAYGLSMMSGLS